MGINAAPFAFGVVFVIVLPAAVRGLDGSNRILFREIIAFHDTAYPVFHGSADEHVNQIRIIAEYIITAPPHDDAWPPAADMEDKPAGKIGQVNKKQEKFSNFLYQLYE